jgi:ribosomal protein S18 acetylase RimI-like enzyme
LKLLLKRSASRLPTIKCSGPGTLLAADLTVRTQANRRNKLEDFIQNRFGYCFYDVREGSALIYNLYVHPEYRMQGKARRLLTLAINEIREAGYYGDIKIEASPTEDGINLDRLIVLYGTMKLKVLTT